MKTKILILAANPQDTARLRLDKEVREIDEGLRRARHREQFDIEQKWAVRISDLRRAILDVQPQIIHFSGHGEVEGIRLENERGNAVLLNPQALAELFGILSEGIQCVVLNACYSETQAEAIAEHIPYVIGMSKEIGEEAAIEFSVGFYDGIGAGKSLEQAYKLGCNAIRLKDISEHLTPVLKKQPGAPEFLSPESTPTIPAEKSPPPLSQQAQVSGGESYQAGRDIIVHGPAVTPKPESVRTKIAAWLGIIAAVLAIVTTIIFDIPQKIQGVFTPHSTRFYGIVVYSNGKEVANAQIDVRSEEGATTRIGQGQSNRNGTFSFIVKSLPKESVWVTVSKNDTVGFRDYLALMGNKRIIFEAQDD